MTKQATMTGSPHLGHLAGTGQGKKVISMIGHSFAHRTRLALHPSRRSIKMILRAGAVDQVLLRPCACSAGVEARIERARDRIELRNCIGSRAAAEQGVHGAEELPNRHAIQRRKSGKATE